MLITLQNSLLFWFPSRVPHYHRIRMPKTYQLICRHNSLVRQEICKWENNHCLNDLSECPREFVAELETVLRSPTSQPCSFIMELSFLLAFRRWIYGMWKGEQTGLSKQISGFICLVFIRNGSCFRTQAC